MGSYYTSVIGWRVQKIELNLQWQLCYASLNSLVAISIVLYHNWKFDVRKSVISINKKMENGESFQWNYYFILKIQQVKISKFFAGAFAVD